VALAIPAVAAEIAMLASARFDLLPVFNTA
jgi:hypothetical protein